MDVLLAITPCWPLSEYRIPVMPGLDVPVSAVQALRLPAYHLLAGNQRLASESCVIFEKTGSDRIWVAPNKGLCVMRRDIWDPKSKSLVVSISAQKIDEVAHDLWLPTELMRQDFSRSSGTNEVTQELKFRIVRCLLNEEVPASMFTPVLWPGTIKRISPMDYVQVTSGGLDLLSNIVNFAVTYSKLPSRPLPRDRRSAWFAGGLAIGGFAGLLLLPTTKSREGHDFFPEDGNPASIRNHSQGANSVHGDPERPVQGP